MAENNTSNSALRILIIDDEANIRLTLGMCLEAEGHTVVAHGNIQDALEEIARRVFDLVFLDIRLGMDNGLEFLPTLRAESPWAQVIVITAFASIETAVEAMKKGATDYLPKPFEPAQVQLVTRKVAERRQLELKVQALQLRDGTTWMLKPIFPPTVRRCGRRLNWLGRSRPAKRRSSSEAKRASARAGSHAPFMPGANDPKRLSHPFPACSTAIRWKLNSSAFLPINAIAGAETTGRAAFCDGGTLFLDEVGQIPARLQTKVLRLIRDREYERVDETDTPLRRRIASSPPPASIFRRPSRPAHFVPIS